MIILAKEQALFKEFQKILVRYTAEYDFTYGQIIGVLELLKSDVIEEHKNLEKTNS